MADSQATLTALLLQQLSVLVQDLSGGQVRDLVAGRSRLAVVVGDGAASGPEPTAPASRAAARKPSRPVDAGVAKSALLAMSSRAEAREYVLTLGGVKDMKRLAAEMGIRIPAKDVKEETIRKIVDATVGAQLSSRAISEGATS